MKKKIAIVTILVIVIFICMQFFNTKPKKVLVVGELMGFEIDSAKTSSNAGEMIATSAQKIGTITFINKDTNEFVALGHSTVKNKSKKIPVVGNCYNVILDGIDKGTEEETGSIMASLNLKDQTGNVYYDSSCGIYGKIDEVKKEYNEVETACWYDVRKGKANILLTLEENELLSYEVEIIGIDYINRNKNIKIKVTDEKLIEKTGGIIQGMSGTPLMQNDKLVGAINYVATDNPNIAYAVFVDKLI